MLLCKCANGLILESQLFLLNKGIVRMGGPLRPLIISLITIIEKP